jgi:hypothetical protein
MSSPAPKNNPHNKVPGHVHKPHSMKTVQGTSNLYATSQIDPTLIAKFWTGLIGKGSENNLNTYMDNYLKAPSADTFHQVGGIVSALNQIIVGVEGPFVDNFYNFLHTNKPANGVSYAEFEKMYLAGVAPSASAITAFGEKYSNWMNSGSAPVGIDYLKGIKNAMNDALSKSMDMAQFYEHPETPVSVIAKREQQYLVGFATLIQVAQQTIFPLITVAQVKDLSDKINSTTPKDWYYSYPDLTAINLLIK